MGDMYVASFALLPWANMSIHGFSQSRKIMSAMVGFRFNSVLRMSPVILRYATTHVLLYMRATIAFSTLWQIACKPSHMA